MDLLPGDDYPAQIKRLRARLGLTQAALAEKLGVSFPTVNRWENGKSRPSQLSWSQILQAQTHVVASVVPPEVGAQGPWRGQRKVPAVVATKSAKSFRGHE